MRNSANSPPPPHHNNHPSPRIKNWTSTCACMTPRSTSRAGPDHRTNSLHLTKTRPLFTAPANSAHQLHYTNSARISLHPYWRMRGLKPNTATKNPCLLFNCSPGLNNFDHPIFPLTDPPCPNYVLHHNIFSLPDFQDKQVNQH